MSKPYVAKYLPVEGEIKIGDRVESESSGKQKVLVTGITKKGDYITDEPDFYEPDSYFVLPKKKAKKFSKQLFLCSRDIQVGDTVWDTVNHKFEEVETSFIAENTEHAKNVHCWYLKRPSNECKVFNEARLLIKVIGEISPEATWVEEGDEFDEYRELWYYKYNGEWKYMGRNTVNWMQSKGYETKLICKVKCPNCKHFH